MSDQVHQRRRDIQGERAECSVVTSPASASCRSCGQWPLRRDGVGLGRGPARVERRDSGVRESRRRTPALYAFQATSDEAPPSSRRIRRRWRTTPAPCGGAGRASGWRHSQPSVSKNGGPADHQLRRRGALQLDRCAAHLRDRGAGGGESVPSRSTSAGHWSVSGLPIRRRGSALGTAAEDDLARRMHEAIGDGRQQQRARVQPALPAVVARGSDMAPQLTADMSTVMAGGQPVMIPGGQHSPCGCDQAVARPRWRRRDQDWSHAPWSTPAASTRTGSCAARLSTSTQTASKATC